MYAPALKRIEEFTTTRYQTFADLLDSGREKSGDLSLKLYNYNGLTMFSRVGELELLAGFNLSRTAENGRVLLARDL